MRNSLPDLDAAIERGDFSGMVGWLQRNVHARGSIEGTEQIIAAATGKPLDAEAYRSHLRARYLPGGG